VAQRGLRARSVVLSMQKTRPIADDLKLPFLQLWGVFLRFGLLLSLVGAQVSTIACIDAMEAPSMPTPVLGLLSDHASPLSSCALPPDGLYHP
jgi:hypothetical protein